MNTDIQYASFLVRLWRHAESGSPDNSAGWDGEVEHIQSGQRRQFNNLDELLMYVRKQTIEGGDSSLSEDNRSIQPVISGF